MAGQFKPRKPLEYLPLPQKLFAYGFSLRKRDLVRKFLGSQDIVFIADAKGIIPGSALLLWGRSAVPEHLPENVQIIRLEDGFLRSVGLGADLIQPVSWVLDSTGIYFDATQASDLENILQTHDFSEDLLNRAEDLGLRIIGSGLTKYNVGGKIWQEAKTTKKIILVPGQVETDASIQYGALGIQTNLELLKTVRHENPEAYVLYKPHPDVLAGLRGKGRNEGDAGNFCDEILIDVSMSDLLSKVDEVHLMTSLTGFEALLRGKPVICYGLPFYAGWGLTRDKLSCPRRTRLLSVPQLVAAALILYPSYIGLHDARHITPEAALEELILWRDKCRTLPWYAQFWRDLKRKILSRA